MNKLIDEKANYLQSYLYLQLLSALYVTFIILTMVVEDRVVMIGSFKILSGTLVLPISYAVSDVITEIYGYKEMRRLIWISIVMLYVCASIIFTITNLPTGSLTQIDTSYSVVFSKFLKDVVTYSIAALISIFLNSYILSRWKILIRGRLFWLRSLGSTAIGEAIFILTWGILGFSAQFKLETLLKLMIASYICKIVYNLVAIIPSALAVSFLKRQGNVDTFDNNIDFNPFSLK